MGSGRARAKQAKVARELKYSAPSIDLDALSQELSSGSSLRDDDRSRDRDDEAAYYDRER